MALSIVAKIVLDSFGAEFMLILSDSIIRKGTTQKYIFYMLKAIHNKSIHNVHLIRVPVSQSIPRWLLCLLMISITSQTAASCSLTLSSPPVIDVSSEDGFEILFSPGEDASGLSAGLWIPDGLQYAVNSRLDLVGKELPIEPRLDGGCLRWDLAVALNRSDISLSTSGRQILPALTPKWNGLRFTIPPKVR